MLYIRRGSSFICTLSLSSKL